jgi:hypothetical protein
MPHTVFAAHAKHLTALKAERLLDAAQAALAQTQPQSWWDTMIAAARGVAVEVVKRAGPLFTFNSRPINTSDGLRKAFSEGVTGGRVES